MSADLADLIGRTAYSGPARTTGEARSSLTKDRVTHDEFLQLLVMQLTHQDPLKPMEDIDFMGQMAQMQALDEQINMTKTMASMRIDTQLQATSALIGKYASGKDVNGNDIAGVVERIEIESDVVYARLHDGTRIPAENIGRVWNQTNTLRNELMGAQAMIGMMVTATDSNFVTRQGIAQKASIDSQGVIWVRLHDGTEVRYDDIHEVSDWYVEDPGATGGDGGADGETGNGASEQAA